MNLLLNEKNWNTKTSIAFNFCSLLKKWLKVIRLIDSGHSNYTWHVLDPHVMCHFFHKNNFLLNRVLCMIWVAPFKKGWIKREICDSVVENFKCHEKCHLLTILLPKYNALNAHTAFLQGVQVKMQKGVFILSKLFVLNASSRCIQKHKTRKICCIKYP